MTNNKSDLSLKGLMASIIKYQYKVVEGSLEYISTRHYKSINELDNNTYLTSLLNISKNRNFNKSKNAVYLLKTREQSKWTKNILTGLFKTNCNKVFYGDIENKRDFVVFVFPNQDAELTIYIIPNYYPKSNDERNNTIKQIINQS